MKIVKKSDTEIWLQEIDDSDLFFQLISEIETCYSFWKYMRGLDDKKQDYS